MRGLVFSIEEFAVYDGPGIRSTVFLKGCPLRCNWCHNPEGMLPSPQLLRNCNACVGCGRCADAMKQQSNDEVLPPDTVGLCGQGALRYSGKYYESGELAAKLLKNATIYAHTGGGVTFSGGEPLLQAEFLAEMLTLLKGKINTAIETSGYAQADVFEKIVGLVDFPMMDIKIVDPELHKKYTGCDNARILENFRILKRSGKQFVIRVPLIPNVTDTQENLTRIADTVKDCDRLRVELLPYNKFAGGKYAAAGKQYTPLFDESVAPEPRPQIWEERNINYKVYA